jgi:hypothetical protein
VRRRFRTWFTQAGYAPLPECPLIRDGETYFIMSSVAAHLDLFLDPGRRPGRAYVTTQRTFSCDKMASTGEAPLATPFEVSGSFFRFGDPTPDEAFAVTLAALQEWLGIRPRDLYVRTGPHLGLDQAFRRQGGRRERLILWPRLPPLTLGPGRPTGAYCFFYAPYRHGAVPVATLGFVPLADGLAVDSAFGLERLAWLQEGTPGPLDATPYAALAAAVRRAAVVAEGSEADTYRWVYLLLALVALWGDGGRPGGRYSGHYVTRLIRELGYRLRGRALTGEPWQACLAAARSSLLALDAAPMASDEDLGPILPLVNRASARIQRALTRLRAAVQSAHWDAAAVARYEAEVGIRREWSREVLEGLGEAPVLPPPTARPSLKSLLYPFGSHPVDIAAVLATGASRYAAWAERRVPGEGAPRP